MKIRVTKGAAQGISDAEPCAHPNHAHKPPHLTISVFGGPWCVYDGEYEIVETEQPKAVA